MPGKFYVTTPIFYVNDKPHVGSAFTMIVADVLARYHRLNGEPTFFLTGTDEHGAKIVRAAEKVGLEPQKFTDAISKKFRELAGVLNLSNDYFIRTTDQAVHWPGVIKIWSILRENGDLYKGKYEGLYCVGHEAFLKKSELRSGICPDHLTKPETIKEENYFFRLTKYKKELKNAYENKEIHIKPEGRLNEVLSMLEELEDISFSRPSKDLPWGINVPEDPEHKIYVWADALTNYLSALGYGRNEEWQRWWPADVHVIGKDILKFHAIIWPAMLLSAGLDLPKAIFVHGFITVDGQKMSKTIGNVIDPFALIKKYGVDPVRYFLLREIPSGEDGDFSYAKLEERYNGDLANGLGNLVQRVVTLLERGLVGEFNYRKNFEDPAGLAAIKIAKEKYEAGFENFRLHDSLGAVWELISWANSYVNEHKPWELAQSDPDHFLKVMTTLARVLLEISRLLFPFLPSTAEKISASLGWDLSQDLSGLDHEKLVIKKGEGLFPRI